MGKRGPALKAGKRTASGRLSRKKLDVMDRVKDRMERDERETLRPGIEARIRVHGVAPEASRDQRAGSFVGRLCMSKEISQRQYEAAMVFLEDHRNNAMAIAAPRDPSGVDLNRVHGNSVKEENVEFYKRATRRWRDAQAVIQERQNELRGQGAIYSALYTCVIRDTEAHHMVGWLREGLNALAKFYQIGEKSRAA